MATLHSALAAGQAVDKPALAGDTADETEFTEEEEGEAEGADPAGVSLVQLRLLSSYEYAMIW